MKLFFQTISWVFMPLLMPIYALMIVFFVPSFQVETGAMNQQLIFYSTELKWGIIITFLIIGVLAPGLSFIVLRKQNMISTIEMDNGKERNLPLLITLVYGILLYGILISRAGNGILPKYIYALPLACTIHTAVSFIINKFLKISLHASGAGILVGFIFAFCLGQVVYQFWIIILVIIVSTLVISSRLYLQKHKPIEVTIGFIVSCCVTFCVTYFYPI